MSLLFIDGFDHSVTADLTKKWSSASGTIAVGASSGRRSGGALTGGAGGTGTAVKTLPTSYATLILGFAFSGTAFSLGPTVMASLRDAGTVQMNLQVNADGTLSVNRNGTALTGGTSVLSLVTGTFYYIEWKCTISDSISSNTCVVKVNGTQWLTVTAAQDTKNTANASANQIAIGPHANIGGGNSWTFDDLYLCDNSGSTNNDFLGDCRVDLCTPNGEGSHLDFTPSTGSTHYTLVDDSTPNTSDYNSSSTVGAKDSYALTDLAAVTGTIFGVQAIAAVAKDDAGSRSVKVGVRTNTGGSPGSTVLGSSLSLGTTQTYILSVAETDPSTGIAWTQSGVNGAEIVVEAGA